MKKQERTDLSQLILSSDIATPDSFGPSLHEQIRRDISSNKQLVSSILGRTFMDASVADVNLSTELKPGPRGHQSLQIRSNLSKIFAISAQKEHEILTDLYSKIGNLNLELAKVSVFNALSAFDESDAYLLFGKLHGIIAPLNPRISQDALTRVLALTDIPLALECKRVDVQRLLQIRGSPECVEFRAWLSCVDQISDKDLFRLLTGFKARATYFLASAPGKAVRFAVNTGLGVLPGVSMVVPVVEGFVDTFLLEKLLPSSGILTFVKGSIPSVLV